MWGQLSSASELPEGQWWMLVFMPAAYSIYQQVSCGQLAPELVFRVGVGGGGPNRALLEARKAVSRLCIARTWCCK